ncbi:MAG: hypothetical protein JOZ41_01475 [Chloroflexi bacterium]|nr:hypothetical protein [Chloroflexota bacterium]
MKRTAVDWPRALLIPLTVLAWLAVTITTLWLLEQVAQTLLLLALSGVTAVALTPLVSLLSRRLPRGVAIALAEPARGGCRWPADGRHAGSSQ